MMTTSSHEQAAAAAEAGSTHPSESERLARYRQQEVSYGDDHRIFVVQDFWVVMTAKLLRLQEVEQLAEVYILSKWFWYDPDFLTKIVSPSGTRLKGEDDVPHAVEALRTGDRVFGCWVDGNSQAFPVNPNKPFLNQIGNLERLNSWTRFDRDKHIVSVQHEFKATVEYKAMPSSFPFDRIVISLVLSIRQTKLSDSGGKSFTWRLAQNPIGAEYKEDQYAINSSRSSLTYLTERKPMLGYRHFSDQPDRPVPCLLFDRNPAYFLSSAVTPLFLIVLACLSVQDSENC